MGALLSFGIDGTLYYVSELDSFKLAMLHEETTGAAKKIPEVSYRG
jgi:hypothetical protein